MDNGSRPHCRAYLPHAQASRHSCTIPWVGSTRQHLPDLPPWVNQYGNVNNLRMGPGHDAKRHLPLCGVSPHSRARSLRAQLWLWRKTNRNDGTPTCELPPLLTRHFPFDFRNQRRLVRLHSAIDQLPRIYCNRLTRFTSIHKHFLQVSSPDTAAASCRKQLQPIDNTTTRLSTH